MKSFVLVLILSIIFLVGCSKENFYNLNTFETLYDTTNNYSRFSQGWENTKISIKLNAVEYYKPLPRQKMKEGKSKFIWEDNTLSFTAASEPEFFSTYSKMTWVNLEDTLVFPLKPITHFNIRSLWKIKNYLVFGTSLEGEYGSSTSGLGFWNLINGDFMHYYAVTHLSIKHDLPPNRLPQNDPTSKFMNNIFNKDIGFNNDLFVVKNASDSLLVFDPQNKNWDIISNTK